MVASSILKQSRKQGLAGVTAASPEEYIGRRVVSSIHNGVSLLLKR